MCQLIGPYQSCSTKGVNIYVYDANLDILCADKPGDHDLKLKVDTGASGNTLLIRIAKQMYGEIWQSKIEHVPNVKLTALPAVKLSVVAC